MFAKSLLPAYRLTPLFGVALLCACHHDADTPAPTPAPAPATYHLGGTLSGVSASGLVLANGSTTVSPAANAATFTFTGTLAAGSAYSVSVQTQPAGLNCAVANGSGTLSADVTSVAVTCTAANYHVGGTLSGLTASGLVLANGSDTVSPAAHDTTFTLPTAVSAGSTYTVTVRTQPTGMSCTVTAGSGTLATADVTSIAVSCATSASSGYTPLAGSIMCAAGTPDQNGTGTAASLPAPYGLVIDATGNVFSLGNDVIDKITPAGVVTTFAGQYQNEVSADGTGTAAVFGQNLQIGGIDAAGNLYLSQSDSIRRITPSGVVTTLAGSSASGQGYADGTGSAALFSAWGVGVLADGTVYVADYGNQVIRKVTPAGVTTTLAGQPHAYGYADGVGAAAQFRAPQWAVTDAQGNTYVVDQGGTMVRKIAANGTVTTLAGTLVNGWVDGPGSTAQFDGIRGLAVGPAGSLYVLDQAGLSNGSSGFANEGWDALRKIDASGQVTTVARSTAPSYFGPPAGSPLIVTPHMSSIATAPDGTLYVTSGCAVGIITLP